MPEKLIRDSIPGLDPKSIRLASDEELDAFVRDKIHEEVRELLGADTREKAAEEAADVFEAVERHCQQFGVGLRDILLAKALKLEKKGGFHKGIILSYESSENPK